jgi:hypothetical protein
MTEGGAQLNMFDKSIAEIRAVQVFVEKTGENLSWSLEYRFAGEDKWYPVQVQSFGVELAENNDEPTTGNTEAS